MRFSLSLLLGRVCFQSCRNFLGGFLSFGCFGLGLRSELGKSILSVGFGLWSCKVH